MVGTWTSGARTQRRIDPNDGVAKCPRMYFFFFIFFPFLVQSCSIYLVMENWYPQAPVSLQVGLGAVHEVRAIHRRSKIVELFRGWRCLLPLVSNDRLIPAVSLGVAELSNFEALAQDVCLDLN